MFAKGVPGHQLPWYYMYWLCYCLIIPQEIKITLTILVPDEWMTSVAQWPFSKPLYRLRSRMPRACHIFKSSFRSSALVTCHHPRWNSDWKLRGKLTQIIWTNWNRVPTDKLRKISMIFQWYFKTKIPNFHDNSERYEMEKHSTICYTVKSSY